MKEKFDEMLISSGWITDSTGTYAEIESDMIVEEVKARYDYRSSVGLAKYGTTLEDSKEDMSAFLNHLQEELMDATLYIEKLKKQIKDATTKA